MSEFEYTVSRVPYLLNNAHIGGYLGPPRLRVKEDEWDVDSCYYRDTMLASVPRFAATSKVMLQAAETHCPKYGVAQMYRGEDDIFAYDHETTVADVFDELLSRPWPYIEPMGKPKDWTHKKQHESMYEKGSHVVYEINNANSGLVVDGNGKVRDLVVGNPANLGRYPGGRGIVELEYSFRQHDKPIWHNISNRQGVVKAKDVSAKNGLHWMLKR